MGLQQNSTLCEAYNLVHLLVLAIYEIHIYIYITYLFVCLSVYLSVYLSIYLPTYVFTYPHIYLPIHRSTHFPIYGNRSSRTAPSGRRHVTPNWAPSATAVHWRRELLNRRVGPTLTDVATGTYPSSLERCRIEREHRVRKLASWTAPERREQHMKTNTGRQPSCIAYSTVSLLGMCGGKKICYMNFLSDTQKL